MSPESDNLPGGNLQVADNLQSMAQVAAQLTGEATLSLDETVVGDRAFELLSALFLQDEFRLSSCSASQVDANSIRFTATLAEVFASASGARLANPRATLLLFEREGVEGSGPERHLVFRLELPPEADLLRVLSAYRGDHASFSEMFTGAGDDALMKELGFVQQSILFSSIDYSLDANRGLTLPEGSDPLLVAAQVRPGLNFRCRAELCDTIIPADVLPLPTGFTFQAGIGPSFNEFSLRLEAPISGAFALGVFAFEIDGIELEFPLSTLGEAYPDFVMRGALGIGATRVNIIARLDTVMKRLAVNFSESHFSLPSVADLTKALNLDNIQDYLPGPVGELGAFSLQSLSLRVDLVPLYFVELSLSLTTEREVVFIDDVLSFTPYLTLRVSSPFDEGNRTVDALLFGRWEVGDTQFNLFFSYPEFSLQAELAPGQSLDMDELSKRVLPGVTLPDIVIHDMELTADFHEKSFEAEIAVASDWEISIANKSFAMRELSMEVEYSDRRVSRCEMTGRLALAGVNMDIYAAYDASDGWQVMGGTAPGETISFTDLFNRLASEFEGLAGNVMDVPDVLVKEDISVRDIFLEYSHRSGDFSFYSSLAHDIKISSSFSIVDPVIRLDVTPDGIKGLSLIKLRVGGIDIILESSALGAGEGWQFSGGTGAGQSIPIGELIQDLASLFGEITLPQAVADLTVEELNVLFKTKTNDFSFSCKAKFPIDDREVDITLNIDLIHSGVTYTADFGGHITLGTLVFDLNFHKDQSSSILFAIYSHSGEQKRLSLKRLVECVSSDVAGYIPGSLEIGLQHVLFALSTDAKGSKFFCGLDLGTSVSLSDLPLVGKEFPPGETVSVDDLRLLVTSKGLTRQDAAALNKLIPAGMAKLPNGTQDSKAEATDGGGDGLSPNAAAAEVIPKGLTVSARMNFGGLTKVLSMPVAASSETPPPLAPASPAAATAAAVEPVAAASAASSDNAKWFDLQKTFGPVYFDKVGVQYKDATLLFLLSAALSGAGLTISLDGLAVGSPLNKFDPKFDLQGLGIDYQGGAVEIGAAFLRVTKDGQPDQYDGTAVIKTTEFKLSAIGSYTTLGGHPSLFIYVFVDYPLGGPAFFFVTGLAAGFGYNRKLISPSIDSVADFPLVKQAVGRAAPGGLSGTLQALQTYIPPAVGEVFLTVGVKFNSFKLIDSFALLTMEFGSHFVVNLLGLSTAIIPTPEAGKSVTPLAEVQIAWKATFDPGEGFLGVDARLTANSYILSRDCHLVGGYAFYSWFSGEHAGDFVQTLGGYHPAFVVPAHYPSVPRLGFNWKVSGELTIKGDAYYALTGSALMAGGHLEVIFDEGDLKAWLKLGADFLISWKPYHYDASIYVDVGVSYTFDINLLFGHITVTISVDIGADLHLWGPDFSGTAHIHLWIISFNISFGAGASQTPEAIDWATFQHSFLPAKNVCSISVKDGLVKKMNEGEAERWVINPKHFSLMVNSAVPLKEAYKTRAGAANAETKIELDGAETSFGIGSMAITPEALRSKFSITITRDGAPADDEFSYAPIRKRIPAGLWGQSLKPDLNGNTFIENVATGFEITPGKQPAPGETARIDLSQFKYASSYFPADEGFPKDTGYAFTWERTGSFVISQGAVTNSIRDNSQRQSLLSALDVGVEVNVTENIAGSFLSAPKIGSFSQ